MAKFVKSNRPVSSNVSANTAMPTGLGAMPANLGATPTQTPVATKSTPVATKSTPVATKSTPVATKSTPVTTKSTPVATKSTPVATKSMDLEAVNKIINEKTKEIMDSVTAIINVEVANLLDKMKVDRETINNKLAAIDEHVNALDRLATNIVLRVQDIEDYLSSEGEECGGCQSAPTTALTFVPECEECEGEECEGEECEGDECEGDECEGDELTPEDIDADKVLAFLRKEPNVSVNVIRSVRNALGRKQFAISSIKNDYDAFVECLEALDSMGIDLEQFVK